MKIVIFFRSLLYHCFFALSVLVVGCVTLPVLLFPTKYVEIIGKVWAKIAVIGLKYIVGLKCEFRGVEHVPSHHRFIFASKHQSTLETVAVHTIVKRLVMVAKNELKWVPVFGWYLYKAGTVLVKRNKKGSSIPSMISESKKKYDQGFTVAIYPDGTRVGINETKKYKSGVTALYQELDYPILPAAINTGVFWPRRSILIYPGTAIIEFLPLIEKGLNKEDCLKKLQDMIDTKTQELVREAQEKYFS